MISTKELYEGILEAYENKKDYLLPTKTTQVVIPYKMLEKICKDNAEKMNMELKEDSNPWELDFGSFNTNDLDNDISDQIEDSLEFIFSDKWEDA